MLKERESIERTISSPCSSLGGASTIDGTTCAGCGGRIQDRYYLLAVDRQWHASCLKCCECKLPLDTELTCFARDGNIYCKEDYYRWVFGVEECVGWNGCVLVAMRCFKMDYLQTFFIRYLHCIPNFSYFTLLPRKYQYWYFCDGNIYFLVVFISAVKCHYSHNQCLN